MLLAITICVIAERCVERADASSALSPSSSIQDSSQTSGGKAPRARRNRVQEAGDEGRGERVVRPHERAQRLPQRLLPFLVSRLDAVRPVVGQLDLVDPLHRAERHAPHALEEPEPEHRRNRPQLADGEGRHLLERADEAIDVVEVDASFAVRDEADRQLVHARIAGQRAARQLGELAIVAAREALVHLRDVLLHDVEVVEQPLAGGPDIDVLPKDLEQARVRRRQDALGPLQAREEARRAMDAPNDGALALRELTGAFGELVRAEQRPADRSGEQVVGRLAATHAKQPGEEPLARSRRAARALLSGRSSRHSDKIPARHAPRFTLALRWRTSPERRMCT